MNASNSISGQFCGLSRFEFAQERPPPGHKLLIIIPPANGPDAFVDFHMVQVPVHFHRRMEVLMTVAITRTDLTWRELHAAGSRSHDARAARRMVAVALVPESADRKSAASSCGMDHRPLRDWLHRYNEGGLEGLAGRRGRDPRLDAARKAALAARVRAGPGPETHGVVGWRRVGLQREVERRLGVTMQERTAGRQLAALGFRRLSVRPHEIRPAGPGGVWKLCRQGTGRPARCGARQENRGVAPAQSACRPAGRRAIPDANGPASLAPSVPNAPRPPRRSCHTQTPRP